MVPVLRFGSESVFVVVMSVVGYSSLILVLVLLIQMVSLRRTVTALRKAVESRQQPGKLPAPPPPMEPPAPPSARSDPPAPRTGGPGVAADVREWATLRPSATGVPQPPGDAIDSWADSEQWPGQRDTSPHPAGPPTSAPALPQAHDWSPTVAAVSTDLVPMTRDSVSPPQAAAGNGHTSPVTVGSFVAGNGKDQDRVVATLNPAARHDPGSWTAYGVVCDGVGGIGDGALAASTALTAFRDSLEEWLNGAENVQAVYTKDLKALSESLRTGLKTAHAATRLLSKDPVLRGSATTLECAVLLPDGTGGLHAAVLHAGDGMIYTLDASGLKRKLERAATDSGTTVLGAGPDVRAKIQRLVLQPGARLILTSDGFEAGLRRSAPPSSNALATASPVAATLLRDGASSAEIAHCLGGLAAAHSPDDVSVVVMG